MPTGNKFFKAHEALLGKEANNKLQKKNALVIGVGGFGCAALLYLAKCGLKYVGICDGDNIDETNLQRQILFSRNDTGKNKAKVAAEKLASECNIVVYPFHIKKDNASSIIKDYDIILDCTDNFLSKFIINDACFTEKKPLIFGNALRWQGMCTLIDTAAGTGCLRCIFEKKSIENNACSSIGVLNSITGFIGALQATEAIKYLTGQKTLAGRLFVYDAEHNTVKTINYEKNINCKTCSAKEISNVKSMCEITAKELKKAMEDRRVIIIDVREPFERAQGAIAGDVPIPLGKLPEKCKELDKNDFIVVYCAHGNRSGHAAQFLRNAGFKNVWSMEGGFKAWQKV